MRTIIGSFGPSARQIGAAARFITSSPNAYGTKTSLIFGLGNAVDIFSLFFHFIISSPKN